jgi:hypothetical protein
MTKRKPDEELVRPRRFLGQTLRNMLRCPLCAQQNLRVVAYRRRSVRLECGACELRFSIDLYRFAKACMDHPEPIIAGDPATWATIAVMSGIDGDLLETGQALVRNAGGASWDAHLRGLDV